MRKVKILIMTEAEEISLFEILAEALGSKDLDLANNIVVIRNKIKQLPVIELPDNFKLRVVGPEDQNPGPSISMTPVPVAPTLEEKLKKISDDNQTKQDIIRKADELAAEGAAKRHGVPLSENAGSAERKEGRKGK